MKSIQLHIDDLRYFVTVSRTELKLYYFTLRSEAIYLEYGEYEPNKFNKRMAAKFANRAFKK
ncbi:MAG: hypothetical protein QOK89_06525 [Nitrososphaeraceae archaeon]|nr:hypothetical protein [Nitrososphaeraceae archaeon]